MFVPRPDADWVIDPTRTMQFSESFQGIVISEELEYYAMLIYYAPNEHVYDTDQKKLNDKQLLEKIQENAKEFSQDPSHSVHYTVEAWSSKPKYDKVNHKLTWGMDYTKIKKGQIIPGLRRELGAIFGRNGNIIIDSSSGIEDMKNNSGYFKAVVNSFKFNDKETYEDYVDDSLSVRKYTIISFLMELS
jgi:uncharacterized membrane-anchored protein